MSCRKSVVDKDDELDELVEDEEDDDEVAAVYAELTDDIVMTRDILNSGGLSALRFGVM